jgi:hypothetical protein
MDYLYHREFGAWNDIKVFQEAEKEAIPMVCFSLLSKIGIGDVPLYHQFSITTQRCSKLSVGNEILKFCFQTAN